MPLRPPAGFISAFYDPLKNPDAPTGVDAAGGDASASVSFTPPANVGGSAISAYYAVSNPGQITASAASSPVSVTGLTNGTSYTFAVWALNTYGPGPFSAASGSVSPAAPTGLFAGGYTPSASNVIQYVTITTTGNATDFGDLTVTRTQFPAGASSSSRGLFAGGTDGSGGGARSSIDYVTIAAGGNAANFGNLASILYSLAACSNSTRGVFAGGNTNSGTYGTMEYVTIATTGNTTYFGDLITPTYVWMGSGSPTRGVFGGGYAGGYTNVIQYITIASAGTNAGDFGDLTGQKYSSSSTSSDTRALFCAGYQDGVGSIANVDYITIATTGNASNFGNLTAATDVSAATGSNVRALIAGRSGSNVIEYLTIASTGNGTDFGDLLSNTTQLTACSNAHGGLQ
jgi:large repetitive protein